MGKLHKLKELKKKNVEKRRNERVNLENFCGIESKLIESDSFTIVEIKNLTQSGCSFNIKFREEKVSNFLVGNTIKLRLYFFKEEFIETDAIIKYLADFSNEKGQKFQKVGCEFQFNQNVSNIIFKFMQFVHEYKLGATKETNCNHLQTAP